MALFTEDQFGNPISEKLSKYLRDWTDKEDRANVASMPTVNVSTSTIRDVVFRSNNLTKDNSFAILELMKIAVANCNNRIAYAKKVKRELEPILESDG